MTRLVTALLCALWAAAPAVANEQTLADIRQELSVLYVTVQELKAELSTTSSAATLSGGASMLDRLNAIEARLQALTARSEELEFRIGQIVEDGTRRVTDLEFRLVELEGGDIRQVGQGGTLGGDTAAPQPSPPARRIEGLTVAEADDFQAAETALAGERFQAAADGFTRFLETYPGSPMTGEAQYLLGEAQSGVGAHKAAARAYLEAFTLDREGPRAAEALHRLGTTLGLLGQTSEACVTLGQVALLYPGAAILGETAAAQLSLSCT